MVVDPSVKRVLDMLNGYTLPRFEESNLNELRDIMNSMNYSGGSNVSCQVSDIEIGTKDGTLKARLYEPPLPTSSLIIYFHGGGFVFGNLDSSDATCGLAAMQSGCKILSVDYRLAPENKFPAAAEDAYSSYVWALKNHETLGIKRNRIAVSGGSAGGNLAAVTCLMAKDRGMQQPRLQILFYPATGPDFTSESVRRLSEGYFLTQKEIEWFGRMYLRSPEDALNPYFSPILYDDPVGIAGAIIVTSEYDPLRDQGESYAEKLMRSGVEVTSFRVHGMIHGFLGFTSVSGAAADVSRMVWNLAGWKLKDSDEVNASK